MTDHKLYVYAIFQPEHGIYLSQEELRFDLACQIGSLPHFISRCLRSLYKVQVNDVYFEWEVSDVNIILIAIW